MLQDSESEDGEDGDCSVQNDTLGGDTENGEEKEVTAQKNKKSRIRQALVDSDDSDTGDNLQIENVDTSRKSVLSENELREERPLKSGKKSRKHKHSFEDEAAEKSVGKPRRRKERERRAESIKQLIKEKKPSLEVHALGRKSQMLSALNYMFNSIIILFQCFCILCVLITTTDRVWYPQGLLRVLCILGNAAP